LSSLTVSELNRAVAGSLERNFPLVRVRGEIASLTKAASGHVYFSLRDEGASVRAVMFRGRAAGLSWSIKEGDQVEVSAVVTLYEPRGDFQIRVESMALAGQGALYEAFLERKARLARAGLLDEDRKRPLPDFVKSVGLVTSLGAAALRDVVVTLTTLMPRCRIRLYPSLVQGADAPEMLIRQVTAAGNDPDNDIVLLVRGGGSLEDLWAFNDEALAYAIADCGLPVIVGVGHETDVTIADLVADQRAATPTAAAQLVASLDQPWVEAIQGLAHRMQWAVKRRWQTAQQRLDQQTLRLRSPRDQIQDRRHRLVALGLALQVGTDRRLTAARARLETLSATLAALDPTAILQRGYAMVLDEQQQVVADAGGVAAGQHLTVRLAKGLLDVRVQGAQSDEHPG
jgi:exodeoxyribonuclease VII large subunit